MAATTSVGENSVRALVEDDRQGSKGYYLEAYGIKASCLADIFASTSFTAQYGTFQRSYLDLSRFQARMDFPSGSKFLSGAASVTQDLLNSQKPSLDAVQAICPNATFSLQQQVPPFLFNYEISLEHKFSMMMETYCNMTELALGTPFWRNLFTYVWFTIDSSKAKFSSGNNIYSQYIFLL